MTETELKQLLRKGEDSRQQFKQFINNGNALTAEMVAFSNGLGGTIFVGIDDAGGIVGVSEQDLHALNQLIANTASQSVRPAINPITENIVTEQGLVVAIQIAQGINKPYMDAQGFFLGKVRRR